MGLYGILAPEPYRMLLQEDRSVEWATVWLFLLAGAYRLFKAIGGRRMFDGLVALFCLFVAGEEFSWGQRLVGYYPAEFFLANNFQQEANLHNLAQTFLRPKWLLMMALGSYGILMPLLSSWRRAREVMAQIGATAPPRELMPWFGAAVLLLLWYPLTLTGEWVEALAGGLFVMSSRSSAALSWTMLAVAAGLAVPTTSMSSRIEHGRDAIRIACAEQEVRALVEDVATGSAGTRDLWRMRRVHKRIWTAGREGYLRAANLQAPSLVDCAESAGDSAALRRNYWIDPWGSPYWLLIEKLSEGQRRVIVYSFGQNRRRDLAGDQPAEAARGDDILTSTIKHIDLTTRVESTGSAH